MTARTGKLASLLCLALALPAAAALRAKYGGTLRIAVTSVPGENSPWLLDSPVAATLASLRGQALCRLETDGTVVPVLAEAMSRTPAGRLRITLRALEKPQGGTLNSDDVLAAWGRVLESPSVYRALLLPFAPDAKGLAALKVDERTLELPGLGPEAESALCHPSLAIVDGQRGVGISAWSSSADGGALTANPNFPEGRPFLANAQLQASDARGAERLLEQKKVQLTLGGTNTSELTSPALYATYLLFKGAATGPGFRAAVEVSADRAQLARIFAQQPAVPMAELLPRLSPSTPVPPKPAALAPAKSLTFLYDASRDDHRAVAERLQVKLKPFGYSLALKGLPRAELQRRWAQRDYDVMLASVLLTPTPVPALGLVTALGGGTSSDLSALLSSGDVTSQEKAVADGNLKLRRELELIPLFAQGLPLASAPDIRGLGFDGFGRLRIENLFFSAEPAR